MKKTITCLALLLCCFASGMSFAQTDTKTKPPTEKPDDDPKDDKIDKLKIAFITTELNLTVDEAEKFWPIYNECEGKIKEIRKANRAIEKEIQDGYDEMTNEDAKKKMATIFENDAKEVALRKEYGEKFSKLLGDKRALKLLSLEHEFKKELLDALREQGPPPGPGGPGGPPPPHGGHPRPPHNQQNGGR